MIEQINTIYDQTIAPARERREHNQTISGEYRGEKVVVDQNAFPLIQDAAEELTFSASEIVEKKISERKADKAGPGMKQAMEQALFYIQQLPDLGSPEKLLDFLEHLKQMSGPSPEKIQEAVEQVYKDKSQQYAALSFVQDMTREEEGLGELKTAVRKVQGQLLEKYGPEVRAGLNVSVIAADFSRRGLGPIQELRDFYRNTVLDYQGLKSAYDSILKNFKNADFLPAVHFLIKALGNDLQSEGPSISAVKLKTILDDLYQVEVLGNLNRDCTALLEKMEKNYQMPLRMTAGSFLEKILTFQEHPLVQGQQILNMTGAAGISEPEARINFLREFKNLVSLIPLKSYENVDHREKFLDAVQEALDIAIEAEEA